MINPPRLRFRIGKFAEFEKVRERSGRARDRFEPPIYNIWKQQDKTSGSDETDAAGCCSSLLSAGDHRDNHLAAPITNGPSSCVASASSFCVFSMSKPSVRTMSTNV